MMQPDLRTSETILRKERKRLYHQQKYQARIAAGLCTSCGKFPPKEGTKTRCQRCSDLFREREKTPERRAKDNARHREMKKRDPERVRGYGQKSYETLRKKIYDRYGNACACCGESIFEFLSIDHKYNDGAVHRRSLNKETTGSYSYMKAIWEDPNPDRFQLLCFNCNMSKGLRGCCPHQIQSGGVF